jgi:hypothetical protein
MNRDGFSQVPDLPALERTLPREDSSLRKIISHSGRLASHDSDDFVISDCRANRG